MTDQKPSAEGQEAWLKTSLGQYILSRQRDLILDLVAPGAGERVLNISCRADSHRQIFRGQGCLVTAVNCCTPVSMHSGGDSDAEVRFDSGGAADLPYSDDEFDAVAVINVLETSADPQKVIAEAIRVCRGRVFIGFLNKRSLAGSRQRLQEIFGFPVSGKIQFFSMEEIKRMVGSLIEAPVFKWGSVIYFPAIVYDFFTELEELVPLAKNPLGAFAGLAFPVKYVYRTLQSPVLESYPLKRDARVTAPEAVSGMLKGIDK